MKKKLLSYIISNKGNITLNINNQPHIISKDHLNYAEIRKALDSSDIDMVLELVNVEQGLSLQFNNPKIVIKNGEILFNGKVIRNSLVDKIIKFYQEGLPFEPLVLFLENLLQNPTEYAIDELYIFLEAKDFAMTEDGCFLAYKRIRDDWMDFYTGSIDNSIGATPKMDRKDVNPDRGTVCSNGLHVCSKDYLPNYHDGLGRVIVVKVNPKNVVTIPADYKNTKMRCCEYTVIQEVSTHDEKSTEAKPSIDNIAKNTLYDTKSGLVAIKGRERGPDGRFIKKVVPVVPAKPMRGPNGRFLKRS